MAEKILDFFNDRIESEFLENNMGFAQFRYPSTGEPKLNRRWVGDNAWLLIAINNYHDMKGTNRFETTKSATYSSERINGFCFDEDKNTVWFEGTGEMEKGFIQSQEFPDLYDLPYVTNDSGDHYGYGELYTQMDDSPHVSSSVWYIFAKLGFDPFLVGEKTVTENEYIWK